MLVHAGCSLCNDRHAASMALEAVASIVSSCPLLSLHRRIVENSQPRPDRRAIERVQSGQAGSWDI